MGSISTATWLSLATAWLAAAAAIAVVAAASEDAPGSLPLPAQQSIREPLRAGLIAPRTELVTLSVTVRR
jgi:hypothetical protein